MFWSLAAFELIVVMQSGLWRKKKICWAALESKYRFHFFISIPKILPFLSWKKLLKFRWIIPDLAGTVSEIGRKFFPILNFRSMRELRLTLKISGESLWIGNPDEAKTRFWEWKISSFFGQSKWRFLPPLFRCNEPCAFFAIFVQLKLGVSHSAREACFLKWLTVGFELARYGCQPLLLRVSARISF